MNSNDSNTSSKEDQNTQSGIELDNLGSLPKISTLNRYSKINRITKETSIQIELNIDGEGISDIKTGIEFLDHLIISISKHGLIDIKLNARSNDGILHHLIEDVGITLAQALDNALLNRSRIRRFGYSIIPMDESIAFASIDLIKRQYYKADLKLTREKTEGVPKEDLEHFFGSLLQNLNACTHIKIDYGDNDHHKIEAAIKAFSIAFRMAADIDIKRKDYPTTKGVM